MCLCVCIVYVISKGCSFTEIPFLDVGVAPTTFTVRLTSTYASI